MRYWYKNWFRSKKNGGLHAILNFIPYNERIEKLAQSQVGRCRDKGSSITMVFAKSNFETLKKEEIYMS